MYVTFNLYNNNIIFRLYVTFKDEDGQDAGGVLREWYQVNYILIKILLCKYKAYEFWENGIR